jgi:hypothetical protein
MQKLSKNEWNMIYFLKCENLFLIINW